MHFNRSLGRGLKMLAILNAGGEHRVASLARAVNLPRSTAFRLLCTLVENGYVWRDPDSDVYRPTSMVLALSDGLDATARLVLAAKPKVAELGKELVWPVVLATLSGTSVLWRQTTDAGSPLAVVRYAPGFRTPIVGEAAGLVLLAFSSRPQSEMMLDLLYRDDARGENPQARHIIARDDIEHRIAETRRLGYACVHRGGAPSDRSVLAVPVRAGPDALAAVLVRFARSAVNQEVIMQRFLPALRRAARRIVDEFEATPSTRHADAVQGP
jgi:IclR family mhp operon transcriptional activator